MAQQIPVDDEAVVGDEKTHGVIEVDHGLALQRLAIVNVVYYGSPGAPDRQWVLIDAGIVGSAGRIIDAAAKRFGEQSRPAAIIMTHGHFDHVGALESLAERWGAPVYAHESELPYLNGRKSYPPADPSVGGGLMAALSPLYPRGPVDVSRWLRMLPADGRVPGMPGWQWVHTPGHTPGHISLWNEEDRTLIAGDAFITTAQESAFAVAMQRPEIHGPPMYYTPDWKSAQDSVCRLAALEPELVVTGHGPAMHGASMRAALHQLADEFEKIAVPEQGRYVAAETR